MPDARYRTLALVALSYLLVNPVLLFLYCRSVFYTLIAALVLLPLTFFFVRQRRLVTVYYFNFLGLFGALLAAEVVFTHAFSEHVIRDLYAVRSHYYFNRPFLKEAFTDKEFAVHYCTNAQGFRIGREDDPRVVVNQADWLFLGDSYTQGAQVENEHLFTSLLYRYFPSKTIVNAGISGFGIPDAYHYFADAGRRLKPQKVFLQVCNFNDFMNVRERESSLSDYLMHHFNVIRTLLYPLKFANPAELPLGRWTEPFYPTDKQNAAYNVFYKPSSPGKEADLAAVATYLSRLNDEVIKSGAELIVLQIPTKEQVSYTCFEEVVQGFSLDVHHLDMMRPNRLLDSLCRRLHIRRIDAYDAFAEEGSAVFYRFDEHLNARGHERLARAVYEVLAAEAPHFPALEYLSQANSGDRYPQFSPDGTRLCYQSFRDGNMELFVADSLLRGSHRVTYNSVDESHPTFLDHATLLFTEGDGAKGQTRLAAVDVSGTSRRYVGDGGAFAAIPAVSRSGQLAYLEWRVGATGELTQPRVIVTSPATNQRQYLTSGADESWRPAFNPNGDELVYIAKKENRFDVFSYQLSTCREVNLTRSACDEWDPAFSPSGRWIAYAANPDDNWDLYLLDLGTMKQMRLTKTSGNEWDPCFSPDGRYLYFAGEFGLRNGIFRLRLDNLKFPT